MSEPDDNRPEPWHRQFWPWFLIALPAAAVAASMVTIYLATDRPHAMVVDDYSKIGLTIQRDRVRDQRAADMGLGATVTFDAATNQAAIELSGDLSPPAGPLLLTLSHPTRVEHDQRIEMTGTGDRYLGSAVVPENSRWYVQIEPADGSWRLAGELPRGARTLRIVAASRP